MQKKNILFDFSPSDVNARATLLNNIPSCRTEPNISDVRKKLKAALKLDKTKLSKRQQLTLASNQELIKTIAKLRVRRHKKEVSDDAVSLAILNNNFLIKYTGNRNWQTSHS